MAYQPIRDDGDEGRGHIRFEFDAERGLIRHRHHRGTQKEYRIEAKKEGYDLKPVDVSRSPEVKSG
jgi:hypothetical protein